MDYLRIYNELIEHRKTLPKLKGLYYESHHILPRCMGGGDEEENLIYLTAEDHFMAHVLLAKAYGGKLWYAANIMQNVMDGTVIKHRRTFAIIREQVSIVRRKEEVYEIVNDITNEEFTITQYELFSVHGLSWSEASRVVSGERGAKGFRLKTKNQRQGRRRRFECVQTGQIYEMTIREFSNRFGINYDTACMLVAGYSKTTGNIETGMFKMEGTVIEHKKYRFKEISTGKIVEADVNEMMELTGMSNSSFYALLSKRVYSCFGYCLEEFQKPPSTKPTYVMKNSKTGHEVKGTSLELQAVLDLSYSQFSNVLKGRAKTAKGYELIA